MIAVRGATGAQGLRRRVQRVARPINTERQSFEQWLAASAMAIPLTWA